MQTAFRFGHMTGRIATIIGKSGGSFFDMLANVKGMIIAIFGLLGLIGIGLGGYKYTKGEHDAAKNALIGGAIMLGASLIVGMLLGFAGADDADIDAQFDK